MNKKNIFAVSRRLAFWMSYVAVAFFCNKSIWRRDIHANIFLFTTKNWHMKNICSLASDMSRWLLLVPQARDQRSSGGERQPGAAAVQLPEVNRLRKLARHLLGRAGVARLAHQLPRPIRERRQKRRRARPARLHRAVFRRRGLQRLTDAVRGRRRWR